MCTHCNGLTLNNDNVSAETAGSALMTLQPANGHDPKPVPATYHYHNLIP